MSAVEITGASRMGHRAQQQDTLATLERFYGKANLNCLLFGDLLFGPFRLVCDHL